MILARRKFLMGLGALMAAPAIVSVVNIMPVKAVILPVTEWDLVVGDFGHGKRIPVGTVDYQKHVEMLGKPNKIDHLMSIGKPWPDGDDIRADLLRAFAENYA